MDSLPASSEPLVYCAFILPEFRKIKLSMNPELKRLINIMPDSVSSY